MGEQAAGTEGNEGNEGGRRGGPRIARIDTNEANLFAKTGSLDRRLTQINADEEFLPQKNTGNAKQDGEV